MQPRGLLRGWHRGGAGSRQGGAGVPLGRRAGARRCQGSARVEELASALPPAGTPVVLSGLPTAAMNGRCGVVTVVSWKRAKWLGCVVVVLEGDTKPTSVKLAMNLIHSALVICAR